MTFLPDRTNRPGIIVGIHSLENKPPVDEKRRGWKAAIVEGLRRNCGRDVAAFPFEFMYWADLRYNRPLAEPEQRLVSYRASEAALNTLARRGSALEV